MNNSFVSTTTPHFRIPPHLSPSSLQWLVDPPPGATRVKAVDRRKKCDETHPKCQRCTKSGIECSGYEYLETRDGKQTKRRTRPAPRPASELRAAVGGLSQQPPTPAISHMFPPSETQSNFFTPAQSTPAHALSNLDQFIDLGSDGNTGALPNDLFDFSLLPEPSGQFDFSFPHDADWDVSLQPPPVPVQFPGNAFDGSVLQSFAPPEQQPPVLEHNSTLPLNSIQSLPSGLEAAQAPAKLTSGQSSLYEALLSLGQPQHVQSQPQSNSSSSPHGSTWPSPDTEEDNDSATSEDDDPEGVRQILCTTPALDSSVASNSLPFVLQSYANWVTYTMFDPLRMVHRAKECLVGQFSSSEDARTRIVLISNVMSMLRKSPTLNPKSVSVVSMLAAGVHRTIALFKSKPPPLIADLDRQNASKALDNTLEIIAIQLYASPLSELVKLMEDAAPVFRRACPEPPDQLVNLPEILLEPGINLRHFAVTDVALSITTGRPMFFRYDVTFSLELCDQMMKIQQDFGMQSLHGIPDQFILLFAWMNNLREEFGTNVGEEYVTKIENDVRDLKIVPTEGVDPTLRIARLVVQESWRQVVYIYLYMALCGAHAKDPRVEKAHKAFMRLVNGIKPGRNPDAFLVVPAIIAGVASTRQRDRDMLRWRLSGLPECLNPGTCGYDALRLLDDIWSRSASEGRAAVWSDLRVAAHKIEGV